jgi:3,4-dihydroxy-2-butanone 4-phosphate synthase
MYPSIQNGIKRLKSGELIIVIDDIETQTGYLMGLAEMVTAQNVNLMTKIGKGLVYVCIDNKKARDLMLPLMDHSNSSKNFTVSIDYKSTTTGISAFERSDTIKAMTTQEVKPDDFKKPGHIFPLVFSDNGLLDHVGIVEGAAEMAKMSGCSSNISYLCEILSLDGHVASQIDIMRISKEYGIPYITISDLVKQKQNHFICMLEGEVTQGQGLGGKIGYPTANLQLLSNFQGRELKNGVYGVKVYYQGTEYLGVMNAGVKPTFNHNNEEKSYEIYIFDFNRAIYNEKLSVEVKFFIREEQQFVSITHLISQIENDIKVAGYKFGLLKGVSVGCS